MKEKKESQIEKISNGIKNSIMIKAAVIGIIGLLLLIPAASIQSLITERQLNRQIAINEVSAKWGNKQTITGPFLTIPYKSYYKNKNNELKYNILKAHFLPHELLVDGTVNPDKLKRGIYEVILYNANLTFSGAFNRSDFSVWNINPEDVLWADAYLAIGIPDMSGVQEDPTMKWNGNIKTIEAGLPDKDVIASGLICRIPLGSEVEYRFSFNINLNGSEQLNFVPVGKKTTAKLKSAWPDPSFTGKFLPDSRKVSETGFQAEWKVLDINRNYPQQWLGKSHDLMSSAFGVNLILPVDEYQKNMRSAKYALLIIAFTFITFFLIEVLNKKKFHPFQYVMVGLAIVLFYSLLLSFTEHVGFNMAYLISAVLVVALITVYVGAIFKVIRLTVLSALLLSVIYFFIYVILQLQDFALLVGSLGLFIALASLMYFSRHIDWYNLNSRKISEA